jgi:hypothetical protein
VRVRTAFHAPLIAPSTAAAADPVFSFAVMPDTQNEVSSTDPRFPKRAAWLVKTRALLDLRWVLHSGDLKNWDTPAHTVRDDEQPDQDPGGQWPALPRGAGQPRHRSGLSGRWSVPGCEHLPVGEQDVKRIYPYTSTTSLMRWVR